MVDTSSAMLPDSSDHLAPIDPIRDLPCLQVDALDAMATDAPLPICACCGGAGWYKERVSFGHPHFGLLFPCECTQEERIKQAREELLRLSNLAAFRAKTFATFDQFVPGLSKAYLRAVAYASQPRRWLVLFGAYGTGKTHLAAAIANEALLRGELVLFVVVPDLLDHLRATFGPESHIGYDERFNLIRNVPLLILDDLGTENTTPWAREKLVSPNKRWVNLPRAARPGAVASTCPNRHST
jgi:DNA replication protein DnaC